jgi:histidinol phosphatase-like enzyme
MFLQAQKDFPEINFSQSVLIGDSVSDMEAGHRLQCRNVLIAEESAEIVENLRVQDIIVTYSAPSLIHAVSQFLLR